MRKRRPFSFLTIFWVSFCSMVCHPLSIIIFFWHAMNTTVPDFHVYLIVAFLYTFTVYKTMRSLGEIDVPRLVRKAVIDVD